MLKLVDIKKDYVLKDQDPVHALKGLSLNFRRNEFVAILGASGCGKTTLLNIIGGLDRYTSGDLIIEGVSTKEYKDKQWDTYRNHSVGFVFQSYNLIGHISILGNVELALTISGISKKERKERATEALKRVGLEGLEKKRPNQLSGGQMQRVAIARALVNDPEILLADEPTGALDSETSIQIMDLLKEVAKDRLVIMVTHNPDLAYKYATRIVKMSDGLLQDDSNPFNGEEDKQVQEVIEDKPVKNKQSAMSFFTALGLSFTNLISKLRRTVLVVIAGSIGIIGVSMVLSVNFGINDYLDSMQDDMLSGNPITIASETYDYEALLEGVTAIETAKSFKLEDGKINIDSMLEYIVKKSGEMNSYMKTNEINQDLLDFIDEIPDEYLASVALDYGFNPAYNLYTNFRSQLHPEGEKTSIAGIQEIYTALLASQPEYASFVSMVSMFTDVLNQLPAGSDYILGQYDLIDGKFATEKDEVMVVLDSNESVTDVSLSQLGYLSQDEFLNFAFKAKQDLGDTTADPFDPDKYVTSLSFDEIKANRWTYHPNDAIYTDRATDPAYDYDLAMEYQPYEKNIANNNGSFDLKVVGILKVKPNISYGCLYRGFYFTPKFTKQVLADSLSSMLITKLNMYKNLYLKDFLTSENIPVEFSYTVGSDTYKVCSGITYKYDYKNGTDEKHDIKTFLGSSSSSFSFMGGGASFGKTYTLRELGGESYPELISIYPKDFNNKDGVTEYLDKWNSKEDITVKGRVITASSRHELSYTDRLELIINLIKVLINIVTAALIAFTTLSLIVSCFMIAVVTYISVVERTKEIGVIRSLGGRKKDVSRLFVAECLMSGFTSGTFGIVITYILSIILNSILAIKNIPAIAALPFYMAIVMIILSTVLNVVSGLAPSMKASKQDPVVALRSE